MDVLAAYIWGVTPGVGAFLVISILVTFNFLAVVSVVFPSSSVSLHIKETRISILRY
jgi:hypothetical protein